jgi:hypothetical protein
VALSVLISVPVALVFALRAGAVTFPVLTLILWRGVRPASLTRAAVLLLGVAVPITYLIVSPRNQGGYDFAYSTKLIAAHWLGVAAMLLLGLAAASTIAGVRRRTHSGRPPSPGHPSTPGPDPAAGPTPSGDAPADPSPPRPTGRPARARR